MNDNTTATAAEYRGYWEAAWGTTPTPTPRVRAKHTRNTPPRAKAALPHAEYLRLRRERLGATHIRWQTTPSGTPAPRGCVPAATGISEDKSIVKRWGTTGGSTTGPSRTASEWLSAHPEAMEYLEIPGCPGALSPITQAIACRKAEGSLEAQGMDDGVDQSMHTQLSTEAVAARWDLLRPPERTHPLLSTTNTDALRWALQRMSPRDTQMLYWQYEARVPQTTRARVLSLSQGGVSHMTMGADNKLHRLIRLYHPRGLHSLIPSDPRDLPVVPGIPQVVIPYAREVFRLWLIHGNTTRAAEAFAHFTGRPVMQPQASTALKYCAEVLDLRGHHGYAEAVRASTRYPIAITGTSGMPPGLTAPGWSDWCTLLGIPQDTGGPHTDVLPEP